MCSLFKQLLIISLKPYKTWNQICHYQLLPKLLHTASIESRCLSRQSGLVTRSAKDKKVGQLPGDICRTLSVLFFNFRYMCRLLTLKKKYSHLLRSYVTYLWRWICSNLTRVKERMDCWTVLWFCFTFPWHALFHTKVSSSHRSDSNPVPSYSVIFFL